MTRTIVDRYELTRPLARGGMGEVWAGYDRRLDRPVAVKLLRAARFPTGTDMSVLSRRFARESRLTARLEHRGVPAVFDAGIDQGDLFLVMQLVRGADLAEVLAEHGPFSVSWATAAAAQVATVLAVAHDASLVHRDLKPRNVMLSPDGAVTVLDFGVAAVLEPSTSKLTSTGETLGSPAYMAPEQAMEGTASSRTDLYALGCILHELLVGEPVFDGDRPLAVLYRHLEDEPIPLRALRPDVPAEIEDIVLALLAKDPADRPADARGVHAALVPHISEDGSDPGTMDPTRPFRRPLSPPSRRPPAPVAATPSDDDASARAEALMEDGRYTQAAEVLEEALSSATSSDEAWRFRVGLATAHFLGGDHLQALEGYREMMAEAQNDTARGELWFRLRSQIAFCLVELGETTEALDELLVVLEHERNRLGTDHRDVFELRRQIAMTRATKGEGDLAVAELEALLRDERRALGDRDDLVVDLAAQIARLRARRGTDSSY